MGLTAAAEGNGGLAVGNIAGTNIVNILFILGLSAWIKPLPLQLLSLKLDLPVMVISAGALLWMAWDGQLSRPEGALMVGAAVAYTIAMVYMSQRESLPICRIPDDHMVACETDAGVSDTTLSSPASAYCS